MSRIHNSPWTDEREAELKRLCSKGLSAGQIAAQLGCTRNAVCGKIDRMGLSNGRPSGWEKKPRRESNRIGKNNNPLGHNGRMRSPLRNAKANTSWKPRPSKRPTGEVAIPPSLDLTLEALTNSTCKYPTNGLNGPYLFCGHPSLIGRSWCEGHAKLCYQPPKKPPAWTPERRAMQADEGQAA